MKKYIVSSVCFLVLVNFILLSCSSENDAGSSDIVRPTIRTTAATFINQTKAVTGGNLTATGGSTITARGVCWSTSPMPTTADDKLPNPGTLGTFTCQLTGLSANTLYYVRAYASNSAGTSYGAQITFTTTLNEIALPILTTAPITDITETSAISGGNVTSAGGSDITTRGICYATAPNPTTADNLVPSTGTTGAFTGLMTGLEPNTIYYVRAYATNSGGTAYGAQMTFTTAGSTAAGLPELTTTSVTSVTQTTASTGGNVTSAGTSAITERGICYATTANPTIANEIRTATGTTGSFTIALSGLALNTMYHVRAYATNASGTAYGNEVMFTTLTGTTTGGPVGGEAICDGTKPTVVVPITSSTGKIWMDRNLGASRAATSSKDFQAYGCLYQWGRGNDGHASIIWTLGEEGPFGELPGQAVNGSTYTLATSDTPPDALFIKDETSIPYDWRNPHNANLWQGVSGTNNPCPSGYRVPTKAEFQAEIAAYSITGPTSAFNSLHKFPTAGDRAFDSAVIRGQGEEIWFWTSTVDDDDSFDVLIQPGAVYTNVSNGRAGGYSVRCIKN